jgi:polyvinyl alcohol dehydrogenase (cytochrome)
MVTILFYVDKVGSLVLLSALQDRFFGRSGGCMRGVVVAFLTASLSHAAVVSAQEQRSGEQVYKSRCAACHERALPRMPNREALREFAPEDIETALSSFTMRRFGAALSLAERRAVAEFLSGRPAGSYRAPLEVIPKSAYCSNDSSSRNPVERASWNGWGAGPRNTRYQPAEAAGLNAAQVPRLRLKWAFGFPGVSAAGSQASIVAGRLFVGTRNGLVYALDARTGCISWTFQADAGVRSTPVVGPLGPSSSGVFFGDSHAQVYGVDATTGSLKWKVKVDTHLDAVITGGVAVHGGRVYVPVSSLESATAGLPEYECCTFRGSLVALDATTGRQVWKTHTISEAPQKTAKNKAGTQLWGPSGAAIWSTPTLDTARNRVYVGTSNSYSHPAARTSDAILALAMDSGRILWTQQTVKGDAWNVACGVNTLRGEVDVSVNCPNPPGPDYDFGSSPALVTLSDGRSILVAGQKSGVLHGLNPDSGEVLWRTTLGPGGIIGGIEWGFATDGEYAYVSLSGAFEQKPGLAGGLAAVRVANGELRWKTPPAGDTCGTRTRCSTGQPAAVTAIPGVVFSGSLDGHLRAYDAATGAVIWDFDTIREFETVNGVQARGGSFNGPGATVAEGMVYVTSGYSSLGFMPGNVLLAFSASDQ